MAMGDRVRWDPGHRLGMPCGWSRDRLPRRRDRNLPRRLQAAGQVRWHHGRRPGVEGGVAQPLELLAHGRWHGEKLWISTGFAVDSLTGKAMGRPKQRLDLAYNGLIVVDDTATIGR